MTEPPTPTAAAQEARAPLPALLAALVAAGVQQLPQERVPAGYAAVFVMTERTQDAAAALAIAAANNPGQPPFLTLAVRENNPHDVGHLLALVAKSPLPRPGDTRELLAHRVPTMGTMQAFYIAGYEKESGWFVLGRNSDTGEGGAL